MSQHPPFEFGLPQATLDTLRRILADCPALEQALVYGSRAMGTERPGSDIDITLKGPNLTEHHLLQLEGALQDSDMPYLVDLSLMHQIDNPRLLDHIHRVGRVLYQRE